MGMPVPTVDDTYVLFQSVMLDLLRIRTEHKKFLQKHPPLYIIIYGLIKL
jgi:hypothetical protein